MTSLQSVLEKSVKVSNSDGFIVFKGPFVRLFVFDQRTAVPYKSDRSLYPAGSSVPFGSIILIRKLGGNIHAIKSSNVHSPQSLEQK